jgi:agmatinase
MPLRTAPLPRMAGHLSFMRSNRAKAEELQPGTLAVIGVPLESSESIMSGARFSPLAIRETSVYFGWYANPQFSNPTDVNARDAIDKSSINERLFDLGDVPVVGLARSEADEHITHTIEKVFARGATSVVLGGDNTIVAPIARGITHGIGNGKTVAFIQIGGRMPGTTCAKSESRSSSVPLDALLIDGNIKLADTTILAPAGHPTAEFAQEMTDSGAKIISSRQLNDMDSDAITDLAFTLSNRELPVIVNLDLSSVAAELHGMSDRPTFDGMSMELLQQVLVAIGRAPIVTLIVTGLYPTTNGLSIVKTGQRLIVTALLGYIRARLGLFNVPDSDTN